MWRVSRASYRDWAQVVIVETTGPDRREPSARHVGHIEAREGNLSVNSDTYDCGAASACGREIQHRRYPIVVLNQEMDPAMPSTE